MAAESRGAVAPSGTSGTTLTVTYGSSLAPTAQSWVLLTVGLGATTVSVTSITGGGTWVQLAAINSAGRRLELWLGYNFSATPPTSAVITRTAGTANFNAIARVIDLLTNGSTLPSFTANAGTTATSASADSGALTPAVRDILLAGCVLASISADSTARTHTGNAYLQNAAAEFGVQRLEMGWCEAVAAVSSKEVWTLATSAEWAAIQVKITPPAPPTPTPAILLKGMTTAAADAASPY